MFGGRAAVHRNGLRAWVFGALLVGLVVLAGEVVAGTAGLAAACCLLATLWWIAYFSSERLVLTALGARPLAEVERPELYRYVRELSTSARLPVPRLFVCPRSQPNSLIVGCTSRTASLCVTDGLLAALSAEELRAVIGHELAHVRRRDMVVSTLPALVAGLPLRFSPVFGPFAALVVRVCVFPSREYDADADGALLAGDAMALASALRKIELAARSRPEPFGWRLAAASHLLIVNPFEGGGLARLLNTHPPAGERLRRLESLAGYPR